MASKGWQETERLVARWFNSVRNPLSGRNNVNDDGSRRLGDVVHRWLLIEIKRHKGIALRMADETRQLAKLHGRPWLHLEFQTGRRDIVKLTCTSEMMAKICQFVHRETMPSENPEVK